MVNIEGFREWINANTEYTSPTKSNIVSRLKRADNILSVIEDEMYLYKLGQVAEFSALSVSVKSQMRRAVKLYLQYRSEEKND